MSLFLFDKYLTVGLLNLQWVYVQLYMKLPTVFQSGCAIFLIIV